MSILQALKSPWIDGGHWHIAAVLRCPLGLPLSVRKQALVPQCPVFGRLLLLRLAGDLADRRSNIFPTREPLATAIVKVLCRYDGVFWVIEFIAGFEHKTLILDNELHLSGFPSK